MSSDEVLTPGDPGPRTQDTATMLGTSPAILACLRCFITVLNIILGVSSLSSQLRRQMMFKLAGLRSPHLSILPRVLPLDGLLPRPHL